MSQPKWPDIPLSEATLRDFYTAHALQGLITKHGPLIKTDPCTLAVDALDIADALLATREVKK